MKTTASTVNRAPNPFVTKHQANIAGVLQGFDRLRLQGTLRSLYHPGAMAVYLKARGVALSQFKAQAGSLTERVRNSAIELAKRLARIFHRRVEERSGRGVIWLVNNESNESANHRFFGNRL